LGASPSVAVPSLIQNSNCPNRRLTWLVLQAIASSLLGTLAPTLTKGRSDDLLGWMAV